MWKIFTSLRYVSCSEECLYNQGLTIFIYAHYLHLHQYIDYHNIYILVLQTDLDLLHEDKANILYPAKKCSYAQNTISLYDYYLDYSK